MSYRRLFSTQLNNITNPRYKSNVNNTLALSYISTNNNWTDENDYLTMMSYLHSINWFGDNLYSIRPIEINNNLRIDQGCDKLNDEDDDYYKNYSHMQYLTSFYKDVF